MTPFADALRTVLEHCATLPSERVPLELAAGRTLVADLVADRLLPARDNSQMDGYAVRSADLASATASSPVALPVGLRLMAGAAADAPLAPGTCARIMTGAPLPAGADAVVMQEDVQLRDQMVTFSEAPEPGQYVRKAGEDVRPGDAVVRSGARLGASELALLAALGQTQVDVPRRPRVALISTGDELVELGRDQPGKLVDSNAVALGIRLRQLGAEVVQLGVVADDRAALRQRFEAARGADVVVSSAGVSVGERDFVKDVLRELGATLHIERVAMRPGKPLAFATSATQMFFGLPGNPVSSRVTFELFVAPAIRALLGDCRPAPRTVARLAREVEKPAALTVFLRVKLGRNGDQVVATPMPKQNSNYLTSLVGSDGLAILPSGLESLPADAVVEVLPLEP